MNRRLGYKLMRLRANGTLGPLFINCKAVIPLNTWLPAEAHRTKGFAFRPGWHVTPEPKAPHLSTRGRIWMAVEIADYQELKRPASQCGTWFLAKWMRVLHPVETYEQQQPLLPLPVRQREENQVVPSSPLLAQP